MPLRSESAVMSLAMKPVSVACRQWGVHQLGHLQAGKMQISTARPAETCGQHHPGLLDHRAVPADNTNAADADGWRWNATKHFNYTLVI